jgi:hypothetical protein
MDDEERNYMDQRLAAAEAVCAVFGWCPVRKPLSTNEAAAQMLWRRWSRIPGVAMKPSAYPHLSAARLKVLAAELAAEDAVTYG